MKNLGTLRYFLGIEVKQTNGGIFISQEKYAYYILERLIILNNKADPTSTSLGLKLSKEGYSSNVNQTMFKKFGCKVDVFTSN